MTRASEIKTNERTWREKFKDQIDGYNRQQLLLIQDAIPPKQAAQIGGYGALALQLTEAARKEQEQAKIEGRTAKSAAVLTAAFKSTIFTRLENIELGLPANTDIDAPIRKAFDQAYQQLEVEELVAIAAISQVEITDKLAQAYQTGDAAEKAWVKQVLEEDQVGAPPPSVVYVRPEIHREVRSALIQKQSTLISEVTLALAHYQQDLDKLYQTGTHTINEYLEPLTNRLYHQLLEKGVPTSLIDTFYARIQSRFSTTVAIRQKTSSPTSGSSQRLSGTAPSRSTLSRPFLNIPQPSGWLASFFAGLQAFINSFQGISGPSEGYPQTAGFPTRTGSSSLPNMFLQRALALQSLPSAAGQTSQVLGGLLGAAQTIARSWLQRNPLLIGFCTIAFFLIFAPMLGLNLFGSDYFTYERIPLTPDRIVRSMGVDYLAGGSCPIPQNSHITIGTYKNAPKDPNGYGHGTDSYWAAMPAPVSKYSYPIPDGQSGYTGCNDPSCAYYGEAIDVRTEPRSLSEVVVPTVCAANEPCVEEDIEWKVFFDRSTTNAGQGVYLEAVAGGHYWRIQLLHIDWNGKLVYHTKTDNVVGTLHNQAGNTHLHFEISMDRIPIDPTPFCDGTYAPGGQCTVPSSEYFCSPDNTASQIKNTWGEQAQNAAMICAKESIYQLNNPGIINDSCLAPTDPNRKIDCTPTNCPRTADYSVGLFQINMLSQGDITDSDPLSLSAELKTYLETKGHVGKSCFEAFNNWRDFQDINNWGKIDCIVIDQGLLNDCVGWFADPYNNTRYAKRMYDDRGWSPWTRSALACGL